MEILSIIKYATEDNDSLHPDNLMILHQFDRGYYVQTGEDQFELSKEVVQCHNIMKGMDDVTRFVEKHAPIQVPPVTCATKYTKWEKGYTCTRAELKALGMAF